MVDSTCTELDDPVYNPDIDYTYRQQTGLPPGSLPNPYNFNYSDAMMGQSPDDVKMSFSQGPPVVSNFDQPSVINPSHLVYNPVLSYRKAYPGMHQERAKQAEAQMMQNLREQGPAQNQQQEKARVDQGMHMQNVHQQPQQPSSRRPSASSTQIEVAASLFAQIQQTASIITSHHHFPEPRDHIPNIVKAKKSDEEMDEDEKVLASEEAKAMDPQKRRQLRNKVSARHFRLRRKEFIGVLEEKIEQMGKKNHDISRQNLELQLENAALREFTQTLLNHEAFQPFVESVVAAEQEKLKMKTNASQAVLANAGPQVQIPMPLPQMNGQVKDSSITPTLANAMPASQQMSGRMSNVPIVNSQMVSPAQTHPMLNGNGLQVSPAITHPMMKVDNNSPMATDSQMHTPHQQHVVPQFNNTGMPNYAPPPLVSQASTLSSHGTTVSPQMQNMVIHQNNFDFNNMNQPLPMGEMSDMGMGNNLMQPMQGMPDIDMSEYLNMPVDPTG